jgi:hypothetical protein
MKYLTLGEAETKRQKAVEFLHRIGNDDLADEFDSMTPEEYAEHKGAELLENPQRRCRTMAKGKSKAELEAELDEANSYIEELEEKLDNVASAISDEDEDEEEDEDDDTGDDAGGDDYVED